MAEPSIALRTVLSARRGRGHHQRCLTLAAALEARGARVTLLVATDDERPWPQPHRYDAVVVDDYDVAPDDFAALRSVTRVVGALDDLADRTLDVDWVLNAAPHAEQLTYPAHAVRLLGPRYALLRPAFAAAPARPIGDVMRGFVLMGGSDPARLSGDATEALAKAGVGAIDLVLGKMAPSPTFLTSSVRTHRDPEDLAAIMAAADLAVSAAGQTLYELGALGVPTVAVAIADNQAPQLASLATLGVVAPATRETLADVTAQLATDRARRASMAQAGRALVDGHGAARAAESLLQLVHGRTHA